MGKGRWIKRTTFHPSPKKIIMKKARKASKTVSSYLYSAGDGGFSFSRWRLVGSIEETPTSSSSKDLEECEGVDRVSGSAGPMHLMQVWRERIEGRVAGCGLFYISCCETFLPRGNGQ